MLIAARPRPPHAHSINPPKLISPLPVLASPTSPTFVRLSLLEASAASICGDVRGRVPAIESGRSAHRPRLRIQDDEPDSWDEAPYPVSGYYGFDSYEDNKDTYPYRRLGVLGNLYSGGGGGAADADADVSSKIFDLMLSFAVHPSEMLALRPTERGHTNRCFLVESAGEMLMIFKLQHGMEVFRMNTDRGVFEPAKSIGSQAIFLGYRHCLSVDADKFPSIHANCIYYLRRPDPYNMYVYDLKDEKQERVSGAISTLTCVFLTDVQPPFTIIQLLSSYTMNAWDSELKGHEMFEGLPDVSGFSAYLDELEFDD